LFGYNLPQRFLILDGTPNGGKGTLVASFRRSSD